MNTPRPSGCFTRVCRFAAVLGLVTGVLHAQNFTGYDFVVPKAAMPNDYTIVDGTGVTLPANRSYVIGLDGGTRNPIRLINWTGSAEYPIVVVNRHGTGRVSITDVVPGVPTATPRTGILIESCTHLQVRGDNDPAHRYGIEIARAGGKTSGTGRRGVEVKGISSDIEICFLEAHDVAFAGIMVKEDPSCDAATSHPNLVYRNIRIHDNYLHDIGGEAMYIGFSFWTDDRCTTGDGGYAHNIEGLRIYNNLVEACLWDGIQVGAATSDVQIFNNVILDAGIGGANTASGDTGTGLQIGGGTTGLVYNNTIINSRSHGITLFGIGHNIIFNNLICGGGGGMFIDSRPNPIPAGQPADRQTQAGAPYYVFNNTFINPAGHMMWTMSDITDNQFKNNLGVDAELAADDFVRWDMGATGSEAGNVFRADMTGLDFVDPANYDFRLLNTSDAVDQGVPLTQVEADFLGIARGQGSGFDAGYAEAGTLSVFLVVHPPTTAGNDGVITASAINGTTPYTYAWSTGATTATLSSLTPGLYGVTVTDAADRVVKKATYLFAGATMGMPVSLTPPTQVEAPRFTPAAGTYATAPAVTLSSDTAGATIRYTTDGSTPTPTNGAIYGGPITVSSTSAIKAIAYQSGLADSTVALATYFVGVPPAAPTLTVTSTSDRRAALSWTTTAGANRYELKVSPTSGGPYTSLGSQTSTAFVHAGLTNGTTYYYVVEAANLYGTSPASAQVTATPFPYPGMIGVLSGFTAGPALTSSVAATGAFNAQPTWDAAAQEPVGDDPVPHSTTTTTTANRFWVVDFTTNYGQYYITEMWTRYRPSSPGDRTGFASLWWDDDKDVVNDGVTASTMNFQTTQDMTGSSAQLWLQDRDFGPNPITPLNQYLVIGTGATTTMRANEFAFIGWVDGAPAAPMITQPPQSQNVPADSSVMFTVGVTGSPAPTYQWLKNGVAITGATNPVLSLANLQAGDAGSYSVAVTNASGSVTSNRAVLVVTSPALTILTPIAAGTATGSAYCGAVGAFNEPPAWDAVSGAPSGLAAAPHATTATAYANRFWFIDFGSDYAKVRITQMWTRYRPSSPGNHPGFAMMWWDDDQDTVNDGVTAAAMNFDSAQALPNTGQIWVRDRDFTATPITPQGRYLVVSTGATPGDRPNEFAFVGYRVP